MKKMTVLAAACMMTAALCAGTVRAEEDLKIIGVKEEGATQIALTNATGRDISEFRIRSTEETEFSDNMLEEGDVFETDETRFFFYVWPEEEEQEFTEEDFAEADAQDGTQEDLPDDKELTVGYDIQITFADDESTAEVNAFPYAAIEEGKICAEDGVAFLIYTDKYTAEEVNTKEYALSVLAMAQEAAKAAEKAAAAQAQQAASNTNSGSGSTYTAPAYTAPAASVPTYTEPAYTDPGTAETAPAEPATEPVYTEPGYTEPAYTEPAGGGEDTCIDDGLFYD